MNLEQFRASRKHTALADAPDYVKDISESNPLISAVLMYSDGLFIFEQKDSSYWLVLERDDITSRNLDALEQTLWLWADYQDRGQE